MALSGVSVCRLWSCLPFALWLFQANKNIQNGSVHHILPFDAKITIFLKIVSLALYIQFKALVVSDIELNWAYQIEFWPRFPKEASLYEKRIFSSEFLHWLLFSFICAGMALRGVMGGNCPPSANDTPSAAKYKRIKKLSALSVGDPSVQCELSKTTWGVEWPIHAWKVWWLLVYNQRELSYLTLMLSSII